MYHISNDKRSKQSSELIWQGLIKCLKNKSFEDITISDLQKASGVARTTFYRSFDNISDVLYWKCDLGFYEALNDFNLKEFKGEFHLAEHYFNYWINNSEILELLIKINRQDIIYSCHIKNAEILQEKFGKLENLRPKYSRYFIAVRTGLTISILTAWLQGGRQETTAELMEIIQEQLLLIKANDI